MSSPSFDVVSDGGLDKFDDLLNDVPVAPFALHFGDRTYLATELSTADFFRELARSPTHPTTSQPTPQQFADLYRAADRPVLNVTISASLSGSFNAAQQARGLVPEKAVELHDSRTLSAAQAFQVHAARTARARGLPLETARDWMRAVSDETELYFTIDTLKYLQRGGRIGRVQATLGGLLNLRPVITVDKATGAYTSVGRARSWTGAVEGVADRVTARFGAGTPLRLGLLYGEAREYADDLLLRLRARHEIVWHGFANVGAALAVHTGPKTVGVAAAPGPWPWER